MIVSIEYVEEDPREALVSIGVELRDWEEDMQLCIAEVPDNAKVALELLADERKWFINWRYERYHEYTLETFANILKKVLKENND